MKNTLVGCALALLTLTVVATPYTAVAQGKVKPAEIRIQATLTGATINGKTPKGKSEYRSNAKKSSFKVELERISLADGTVLDVKLNGGQVGTITLALKRGELELESKKNAVPVIKQGDWVSVCDASGVVLLSGQF